MEELTAKIVTLEVEIEGYRVELAAAAQEQKKMWLEAITADTARLTGLEARKERLEQQQQQPQAGEYFVCV
jgi:hypothetical protein